MQAWIDKHTVLFVLGDIAFVLLAVSTTISYTGGWHSLSRRFRFRGKFQGQRWRCQNIQMRGIAGYHNCITLGVSPQGLYLAVSLPLFRIAHPPLLIPWDEISLTHGKLFFVKTEKLQVGRESPVPVWIRVGLADKLKTAAGSKWPIERLG